MDQQQPSEVAEVVAAVQPITENPTKPRSKKRKTKVLRDSTAPRQPLTGYVRYLNERRETLRQANPRLGFAEVTRKLASEWGRLPAEEKQQYLDAAEQDRERYVREWSAYKETDAYRVFRQQQLERKEAASTPVVKKPRASGNLQNNNKTDKTSDTSATMNGGMGIPSQPIIHPNSIPTVNRPKAAITPSTMITSPTSRIDGCHREVDIPIFTEQFLQHNKLRETELRQLRKANIDYEQQNAILQKHIENMKNAVERTKSETAAQVARTAALHSHFNFLVDKLVTVFGSVALPEMPNGATKQNIEQYMESLRLLTLENKNTPLIKQAKDLLIKIDVA